MTTFVWIHIHDVIDDVTRSQSRSNFEIDISASMFELERRSKAQNVGNTHGYLFTYSTSGITSGEKVCCELKMTAILKILIYWTKLQSDLRYEKIVPNYVKKVFVMVMASSMTSQGGLKVSLYIHVKERLAPGASCKGNVSSINANIIIIFLGYTRQNTISMNNTFRDCRSKVNITGLVGDLGT